MENQWHARKLVTIIAEAALERALVDEARAAGASGYTVTEVRGGGAGGERPGEWGGERTIEFRVICDEDVANRLADNAMARFAADYSMVLYLADVAVRRAERFP